VEFSLANVYAPCSGVGRVRLWQELSGVLQHHGQTAWCVLGDFNAIRSSEERKSRVRRLEVLSEETHAFNQFIEANSLIDLPLCGRKFTWYSSDGRAMSRLDRFFLSDDWVLSLPNCIQTALPRTLSDHCPIVLAVDDQNWGPRPLRMMKCWSDIDGYSDFVTDKWNSMRFSGWSGYILKEKLKKIKADLRNWHLTHTSNIDSRIEGAKKRLDDLDTLGEIRGLDEAEEAELILLPVDIMSLSKLQASMQWQKSRVQWLKEGDANTKFFHGIMKSRKRRNSIGSFVVDGRLVEEVSEVRQLVFNHFSNHYRRTRNNHVDISDLCFKSLSVEEGAELTKPFLLEEIKKAIWDCDSFKSPGPDGVNLGFFKDFWEVLKIDLLNFFSEFHRQGILSKGLNSTFIALIPKVDNPQRVADFRPIALVNSVYKLLSKVLTNRLRSVIASVVSQNQSAFIQGRQILDGILVANEVVDDAKRNRKEILMFKVDFEKAYDSVDWEYLDEVMKKMNFPIL
jgi:hypothetical protein